MKILVVDDSVYAMELAKNFFSSFKDIQVIEACDGLEAIDKYDQEHPDVVVMDINMPRLNGLSATMKIKEQHPEACIIVTSSGNYYQLKDQAVASGARAFIEKPINFYQLQELVELHAGITLAASANYKAKVVRKILIVDDSKFMRKRYSTVLKQHSYILSDAIDGLDAIEKYKQEKPDLVFMDIDMPHLDGVQAVQKIKELDNAASIVIVSSIDQQAMITQALRAGAVDFILKPFDTEQLVAAIQRMMPFENTTSAKPAPPSKGKTSVDTSRVLSEMKSLIEKSSQLQEELKGRQEEASRTLLALSEKLSLLLNSEQ